MAKNIVICADGTGNSAVKGRGTNVFKLYEAVDRLGHHKDSSLTRQVAIYHDGVGTEDLKWIRIASGATGWGLGRNVKQLYGELARVYDPGDQLFFFGFSRGAFTVRTLAGLIANCGILDVNKPALRTNRDFNRAVDAVYAAYRTRYAAWAQRLWRAVAGEPKIDFAELRERLSVQHADLAPAGLIPIAFIGVWDTVDAVGVPFQLADVINTAIYRFKFPDTTLNPLVAHACHALALDEERASFSPLLWEEGKSADPARIHQVWFAGVHSNVGGGYEKQGMSLVPLAWMAARAQAVGLRLIPPDQASFDTHRDVDDKLYDPRAGAGLFYRWQPRDVAALCQRCGVRPKVHVSAFERLARNTDGYACGTIPPGCDVVGTFTPPPEAAGVQKILRTGSTGTSLLEQERSALRLGQVSYWMFLTAVAALAAVGLYLYAADTIRTAPTGLQAMVGLVTGFVSGQWITAAGRALWPHPRVWGSASAALAIAYAIELIVDRKMDDHFSEFWHGRHQDLKKALGL